MQACYDVQATMRSLKILPTDADFVSDVSKEVADIVEKCCLPDTEVLIHQTHQKTLPEVMSAKAGNKPSLKDMVENKIKELFGDAHRYFEVRFADEEFLVGLDGLDATRPEK